MEMASETGLRQQVSKDAKDLFYPQGWHLSGLD
jgi:hypothetical protein